MTTVDGSDLVQSKEGVQKFAGAPLLQDASNLTEDLKNGDDVYAAIDSGLVALDVLGMAMDPFGSLFGEVAGFIIEHVGFLNQFMDDLTGDPQGIEAASATWKNIGAKLMSCAQQYDSALSSLPASWNDPASAAYTTVGTTYSGSCYALGGYAYAFSEGITLAGVLCAKTRQDVYDAIGDFITDMVIEGLAALATSWCSFGGTVAAWIAAMEVQGDLVAASISDKIAAMLGRLGKFAAKFAKDSESFRNIGDKLTEASTEFKKGAESSRKEAQELQERADHIGDPPGKHAAPPHSGHGEGGGGAHRSPPPEEHNPLEHLHGGVDTTLRGGRDELNAHQPRDEGGEGGGGEKAD